MLDRPGVFTYRDGVAVIQLVFFSVYLVLGFVLCRRHGFRRREGWVILLTFSTLRLLGASFQLASITHPNDSVYGGALICEGIGLVPLTLLNLALFQRANKWLQVISPKVFAAISLVTIAGLALGIYGGTQSASDPDLATNTLLKVSILLFVGAYVAFVCLFLVFLRYWNDFPKGERKLLVCFAACAPFMAVRFLYNILGDLVSSLTLEFNVLVGNVTIFLCMSVLEEIVIVGIIVVTGLRLQLLPPELRNPSNKAGQECATGAVELQSNE